MCRYLEASLLCRPRKSLKRLFTEKSLCVNTDKEVCGRHQEKEREEVKVTNSWRIREGFHIIMEKLLMTGKFNFELSFNQPLLVGVDQGYTHPGFRCSTHLI